MKNIGLIIGAIILLASCTNVDTETIQEIEKWESKLDSAHQVYLNTDFDSINKMVWKVKENEKAIKRLNSADTIYSDMVKVLDDYKWIRKKVKNVEVKKLEYKTEFDELKLQLENLKLDVQNGVRTSEENKQYLSNEVQSIKVLMTKFSKDHETFTEGMKRFGELNGKVQVYVDQLKRDKGIIK